jgi:hypothetical protein
MATSNLSGGVPMNVTSQIHWFREHLIHPIGILQIRVIGITLLITRIILKKIRQHLEKTSKRPRRTGVLR